MKGDIVMNAKVVLLQFKPGKHEEAARLFKDYIVPAAKKQKGFKSGLLLIDPNSGKGMSIAIWESESDIKASENGGFYQDWTAKLAETLVMPPVRELYEVINLANLSVG
jgi:heme-degrading monooxygenase HmoA